MNEKSIPCSWCRAALRADAKTCSSCGAPQSQKTPAHPVTFARALPPGTPLRGGDYTIQSVIGQGRFGITYRALNHRLHRVVAVKEWFPATCERDGWQVLAGPNSGAREFEKGRAAFLAEARGLAQFEHPAIVSLFAVWEENRSAYMEMELLHGPTLAQVLERFHHLKTTDALRLFAPLLDALEQLHAHNWLHRDFNPHNIVLRDAVFEAKNATNCVQNSRAVLIDFGAARQISPDVSQEISALVTPGYAPLEQYARRARRGAYSDIYALCATLYHALSGQTPPAAADRASGAKLLPLRELAPAVPENLCRAIERGLEIEIARRPQTVRELRELLPMLPVAMPTQNVPQVLAAPVMPMKSVPQVLAAPSQWPQWADDARATANVATDKKTKSLLWWLALGPFGFALLFGVLRPRPRPQVEPNWSAPATRLIAEPPLRFEPPRRFEPSQIAPEFSNSFSSKTWIAEHSEQNLTAINSVTGQRWQWQIEEGELLGMSNFAPNDSWLMATGIYNNGVSAGGRVWFFDLKTGKIINVWSGKPQDDDGAAFSPFFSPRGRYVGIKRFPNVLRVWEVRTHRDFAFRWSGDSDSPRLNPFTTGITEFSPDETHILLAGNNRNLWLVDLRAQIIRQAQLPLITAEKSAVAQPISISAHFSVDGQFIDWADNNSSQTGRLSLDDFNQKVPVEIIDGATSRPR